MYATGLQLAVVRLQARRNGAAGVELDLEFSADGVPILMHDETVERTTNGSGALRHLKMSQLVRLDAAAKHRLRWGRSPLLLLHIWTSRHWKITFFFLRWAFMAFGALHFHQGLGAQLKLLRSSSTGRNLLERKSQLWRKLWRNVSVCSSPSTLMSKVTLTRCCQQTTVL